MKKFYFLLTMLVALAAPQTIWSQVTVPYTEGFESMSTESDLASAGWELLYKSDARSFLAVETSSSNVQTGAKALDIDSYSAGVSGDYVVVGLPLITNKGVNELQISFSYKVSSGTVYIGYLTDANDGTTFLPLSDFNSSSDYTTKTVELNDAPASAVRIAIKYLGYYRCYMDDITVEELPSCFRPKSLAYSSVTAHEATLTWERHAMGTENAWVLEYSTASDFTGATSVNVTGGTPSRTLSGLAPETQYYVRVKANCGGGDYSVWSEPVNFTTPVACPAPTALAASDITNHTAELTWTGTSDSYKLRYRTAAYINTPALAEEFSTGDIPAGWTRSNTQLTDDVLNGITSLNMVSTGWYFGTSNGVFDSHARINIYGTNRHYWLITPATTLNANSSLSFDLALTAYNGTLVAPQTTGTDDRFVVLITDNDGDTWTVLRQWDNAGSAYVYNNIASTAAGENVLIDLSSYDGQSVKIAFYGNPRQRMQTTICILTT